MGPRCFATQQVFKALNEHHGNVGTCSSPVSSLFCMQIRPDIRDPSTTTPLHLISLNTSLAGLQT